MDKKKSEIVTIFNKYKNTLDDHINSLDIESLDLLNFPNLLRLINKSHIMCLCQKKIYQLFLKMIA